MSKATTGHASEDDGKEIRKRAFERKARQATHQLLFYLGLYYRPITFWTRTTHPRTNDVLKHDSQLILARLQALVDGVGYRDDPVEADSWKLLRRKIKDCTSLWPYQVKGDEAIGDGATDKKLQELRDDCARFLRESRPRDFVTHITHLINTSKVQIRRWLAKILVSIVAIYVLFFFQQVAGLLRQTEWSTLLPFMLFLMVAVGPDRLGRWANHRNKQYWWDFGGQPFRNGAARPPERGFGRFAEDSRVPFALMFRVSWKIVTYLVALAVALLLTFIAASWQDMILFTVGMILALLFLLYGAAKLLDFWDFYDSAPVRMFFLLLLLLALIGINTFKLWLAPAVLWAFFFVALLTLVWRVRNEKTKRLQDALRANGQGIAITAGLFLMAWLVTNIANTQFGEPWHEDSGSIITRLTADDWPMSQVDPASASQNAPVVVMAASGGGSRAAIYVAHTLLMLHEKEFRHIGCNLQAVSSVSGGSLANAVYITQRLGKPCDETLYNRLTSENGLMKAVAGDFLQPTILGALRGTLLGNLGGGGRSERIEKTWRDIGLDVKLDKLVEEWKKAAKVTPRDYPPFPIPLFNSTSLETHRVVLSPLERTVYAEPVVSKSAREANLYDGLLTRYPDYPDFSREAKEPTWVYYRDGIYGLEDLLPKYSPNLAQCVRASANFPIGFPLVQVETTQPLFYSPNEKRRKPGEKKAKDSVYLSDGGVLSNSGLWSLYHLLRNQQANLKDRGVLVIIVDASAMPNYEEPTRIEGLFSAIRSQNPIGQSLHRRMFESLKSQYGQRIQIVQIDLLPTETTNIETTWTLSAESKKSLRDQFIVRRPEFEEDLNAAWNVLVSQTGEGPMRYLERPPID